MLTLPTRECNGFVDVFVRFQCLYLRAANCTTGQLSRVSHWSNFEFLNNNKIMNINVPALALAIFCLHRESHKHLNFVCKLMFVPLQAWAIFHNRAASPLRRLSGKSSWYFDVDMPPVLILCPIPGSWSGLGTRAASPTYPPPCCWHQWCKKGLVFKSTQSMVFIISTTTH